MGLINGMGWYYEIWFKSNEVFLYVFEVEELKIYLFCVISVVMFYFFCVYIDCYLYLIIKEFDGYEIVKNFGIVVRDFVVELFIIYLGERFDFFV